MLAGGGEACTDIEAFRSQATLFGEVPSDSTLWRVFHQLDGATRERLWNSMAEMRAQVWARSSATMTGEVALDIDASLHEVHSENKEGTAPTYKGRVRVPPDLLHRGLDRRNLGRKRRTAQSL